MKGDYSDDPEMARAYAFHRGEIEPDDDEPPREGMVEKARRFEEAPTREAKLDVLKDYMSERSAIQASGIMLGEHDGDVVWKEAADEAAASRGD